MWLAFERALARNGALMRRLPLAMRSFGEIPLRLLSRARRRSTRFGSSEFHSGSTRLRQPNRDCLLGVASTVLAATNVFHLLANEFAGLSGWRFSFCFVFLRTL
jgi:hypothetical protein